LSQGVDPVSYWKTWAGGKVTRAYWEDPMPDWQGMLSSDLIAYYHQATGGLIEPWDLSRLKPAAYELTLGPNYLLGRDRDSLRPERPWLTIPPNSIVFVSMEQQIRLPHYMVARFDLAIEFIYQGILLGTGPQVDPGFQGVLSCPLHNISNDAVHIRLGHPFAKMDFAKTSGLLCARQAKKLDALNEDDLQARASGQTLPGFGGGPVKLFSTGKRWREPIYAPEYVGNKYVRSSLASLAEAIGESQNEVAEFGGDVRQLRRFGLASAVAVVLAVASLLIGLAQFDRSYTDAKVDAVIARDEVQRDRAARLGRRVVQLERVTDANQRAIERLLRRLAATQGAPSG
jgi:deoxycytidine triphosphate deaminase